jgi:hypothetical protein
VSGSVDVKDELSRTGCTPDSAYRCQWQEFQWRISGFLVL